MNKINYYHSLIFFNLCILLSAFDYLRENTMILFSLFLILSIGITHGSLDHIKGAKLFKILKVKNYELFFVGYILTGLIVIFFWLLFPKTLLFLFLVVASYHFGKEDSDFLNLKKINYSEILFFLKGLVILASPLLFHKIETLNIFETINFAIPTYLLSNNILILLILLSLLSNIIISKNQNLENKSLLIMDFFSILILNIFLKPLLAFTLYFCLLHSIRHSFSLIYEIDKRFIIGLKNFLKKALPLTLITAALYLISILYLSNNFGIDASVNKVIFIGLASLTFPHILLEYLIEKNEK